MSGERKSPLPGPPSKVSTLDAVILGGAILGILIGVSFLSGQAAAAVGVLMLTFVVYKLLSTKS